MDINELKIIYCSGKISSVNNNREERSTELDDGSYVYP